MKTYTYFYFNTKNIQEQIPQMYLTALCKYINQKCLLLCTILREGSVWLSANEHYLPLYGLYNTENQDTLQEDFTYFQIWGTWSLIAGISTINYIPKSLNPACHFVVLLTCMNPHNVYIYLSFTKPLVVGDGCPPSFSMRLFKRQNVSMAFTITPKKASVVSWAIPFCHNNFKSKYCSYISYRIKELI